MRCAVCLLPLLLAACAATPRPIELLPDPDATWKATGFEHARMSVVAIVVEQGLQGDAYGAGVIYDSDGHILTAHHVIEGADRILLLVAGGYTVRAEVVAEDPIGDFAILKAEVMLPDRMKPAVLAIEPPVPGESVWNIGNPFGTSRYGGDPSVGRGVISAVHRSYFNQDTGRLYLDGIQHDAPTNPGNSGGGVFNERGELLGLNAIITTLRETPADSGVAFALPAPLIKRSAEAMLAGRAITHGWFGGEFYKQATEIYSQGYGRLRAVFGPIAKGSPAEIHGIQQGDVLIKIDGVDVYGIHEALMLEDALVPGQLVRLTINRAGREFETGLSVGQRPWKWN